MKRISILVLLLTSLVSMTSCSSDSVTKEDLDAVKRRLTSVEKRVKAVEGKGAGGGAAKAGKAKGGGGGAKAKKKGGGKEKKKGGGKKKGGEPNAPTENLGPVVQVDVEGEVSKVVLMKARKKYSVPGEVPADDEYTILAVFPDTKPMEAGRIEIGDEPVTVTCDASTQTCTTG